MKIYNMNHCFIQCTITAQHICVLFSFEYIITIFKSLPYLKKTFYKAEKTTRISHYTSFQFRCSLLTYLFFFLHLSEKDYNTMMSIVPLFYICIITSICTIIHTLLSMKWNFIRLSYKF